MTLYSGWEKANNIKSMKISAIYTSKDTDSTDKIFTEIYPSPIGGLCIGASVSGLKYIKLIQACVPNKNANQFTTEAIHQLQEYFGGQRQMFNIALDLEGYSHFSIRVWEVLQQIPFGKTISYQQLAIALGDIKCIRAAASANGKNPLPIIIPCHRVIGSDGSLTGFALGLDIKRKLLAHESPHKFLDKQMQLDF